MRLLNPHKPTWPANAAWARPRTPTHGVEHEAKLVLRRVLMPARSRAAPVLLPLRAIECTGNAARPVRRPAPRHTCK